jgi:hypothetical protein
VDMYIGSAASSLSLAAKRTHSVDITKRTHSVDITKRTHSVDMYIGSAASVFSLAAGIAHRTRPLDGCVPSAHTLTYTDVC